MSVWLYWRKERYGNLSFEGGLQNLQCYTCPAGKPLVARNMGVSIAKTGLVQLKRDNDINQIIDKSLRSLGNLGSQLYYQH